MWKSSGLVLLRRSLSSLQNQPLIRFKWVDKIAYFRHSFFSTDSSSSSPSSQTQSGGGVEGQQPISFSEAKKLMRLVNVEALKRKLGMDGDEVIAYSQLLKACQSMGVARSHDEAVAFTRILDEAGVFLLFRDKVYLHPDKMYAPIS